jgi:hypothetical protein
VKWHLPHRRAEHRGKVREVAGVQELQNKNIEIGLRF